MQRKRRYKSNSPVFIAVTAAAIVVVAAGVFLGITLESKAKEEINGSSVSADSPEPDADSSEAIIAERGTEPPQERQTEGTDLPQGRLTDWNLILLNPEETNKIDADLNITLASYDGQSIDSRIASEYEAFRDAAAEAGVTLFLRSGFRSMETQKYNYNARIQRYQDEGKSYEQALALTNQYYTVPGHSEHHTGLALDIITPEYHNNVYELDNRFADTEAYQWLSANCAEYGFILRYPQGKEDITQINFEPWHYRYVGREHAAYMMERQLCLEEYIGLLRADGR